MEEIKLIIKKINIPTLNLNSSILQDILVSIQRATKIINLEDHQSSNNEELWNNAAELLWFHLEVTLAHIDDQLLCATGFYNILIKLDGKEAYFKKIIREIDKKIATLTENSNILFVISLLYGVFQSSLLPSEREYNILIEELLSKSFDVLIVKANEYTQYTFVIFKIIASYKKVFKTVYKDIIFNYENNVKLLNLVCHNWENPIAGIRDVNKDIFQIVLFVCGTMLHDILREINDFPWNKAKYFMLTEIISQETKPIVNILVLYPEWIDGNINSLYKSGLVSAGADMYFAILKKFRSEDEWYSIFFVKILTILNNGTFKAKENFINYWCLNTLKVYPQVLTQIFNGIVSPNNVNLHSALSVMKQGNRLGIVKKNWEDRSDDITNMLIIGLQHVDPYVRMASFDIICISQGTSLPTSQEYDLIYAFLIDNVNSDCTVLRIGMLNSFRLFLNRLHVNFLHLEKQGHLLNNSNLYDFCKKIQRLIENSLMIGGNYQRKITIIKIYGIFISSLSEIPRKRNKKKGENLKSLIQKLKEGNMWYLSQQSFIDIMLTLLNDPAEDIKENTVKILQNYYCEDLINLKYIDKIIESAQNSIKSKFFYEISSGYSMFKLITILFVKYKIRGQHFNSVEEIFNSVYKVLITEHKSKTDIITLIENGKQLHAFITILNTIFQVCLQNKYSIYKMLTVEELSYLLQILKQLSIQFVEEDAEGSSDFSKINDMVNEIIIKSGSTRSTTYDVTKISGLQQIVLNVMWLNVKSSCDLSSTLIKCYNDEKHIGMCRICLDVIANVLESCRHKGAIEAAGVALGQSIQHLTSLPLDKMTSVPDEFLKQKLIEMINEANKLTSITRRGAGLSIMVHRIVSSDMRKGKPLFHIFMKTILEACARKDNMSITEINDNALDLPKAIYIHLLTRVVTDSSLASDIMFYSSNLAEIAFDHLRDDKWQIRNAALQLYGALVPKLIGQKKCSTTDEESIATVACDEFRVHSPNLWKYIQDQINKQPTTDTIQHHSNLVPILNLLSSCAKRYNFSYDLRTETVSDNIIFNSFTNLLNSPIYNVRYLSAKCIFNMFQFEQIYKAILAKPPMEENCLHGCLMLIKICYNHYFNQQIYQKEFESLKEFFKIYLLRKHSYLSKSLYDEMFLDLKDKYIQDVMKEVNLNKHSPGGFTWSNIVINKFIKFCELEQLPKICKEIFKFNNIGYYGFIKKRLLSEKTIPTTILEEIVVILLNYDKLFESNIILEILFEISKISSIVLCSANVSKIFNYLDFINYNVPYRVRHIIPLAAHLFYCKSNVNVNKFMANILSLNNIENADVDMRYLLSLANNEFGNIFKTLSDEIKILSIEAAIVLLQDEDEDVRNCSTYFLQNICKNQHRFHPYICLKMLVDIEFLQGQLKGNNSMLKLCEKLESLLLNLSTYSDTKDSYNPFANDFKNIYFEADILKENVNKIKKYVNTV